MRGGAVCEVAREKNNGWSREIGGNEKLERDTVEKYARKEI